MTLFALILIVLGLAFLAVPAQFAIHDEEVEGWIRSIGSTLLTAGAVTFLWDRITVAAMVGEITEALEQPLDGLRTQKHGVRSVATEAFYDDLYQSMARSSELTVLQTWVPDVTPLLKEAGSMMQRGGQVTIYTLHPESEFAKQRGRDLDNGPKVVSKQIMTDALLIQALHARMKREGARGSIQLFWYNRLPALGMYQVDHRAWIGLFWYTNQSDRGTKFVLDRPSSFWQECDAHLSALSKSAQPVDLDAPLEDADGPIPRIQLVQGS